jgi:hypothetical protein
VKEVAVMAAKAIVKGIVKATVKVTAKVIVIRPATVVV